MSNTYSYTYFQNRVRTSVKVTSSLDVASHVELEASYKIKFGTDNPYDHKESWDTKYAEL